MKTIVIANQKGGAAKTTTAGALSTALKRKGYSVLVIDMDPQANLTDHFGVPKTRNHIYAVLNKEIELRDAIYKSNLCDIIPSSVTLTGLEKEPSGSGAEFKLKDAIQSAKLDDEYDFVIVDTPPLLGTITIGSLIAADNVIVPVVPDLDYLKGFDSLSATIKNVRRYVEYDVKISGVLFTKFNGRINNSKEVMRLAKQFTVAHNTKVFDTFIRESVVVIESHAKAMSLWEYCPENNVAIDYAAFCEELLKEVA